MELNDLHAILASTVNLIVLVTQAATIYHTIAARYDILRGIEKHADRVIVHRNSESEQASFHPPSAQGSHNNSPDHTTRTSHTDESHDAHHPPHHHGER